MSDRRLRELERVFRQTGAVEDEAQLLLARQRAGSISVSQIYTAAYLDHEAACRCLDDGLYDYTGKMNDHLIGICPCGDCRWNESPHPQRWMNSLLGWGQNLPFPGIDGPHAEQEMLIRMGRALAAAVWEAVHTPEVSFGAYRYWDKRAQDFLEQRNKETRTACWALWTGREFIDRPGGRPDCPEWAHQVLYYIVNPGGWRENTHQWFVESATWLSTGCNTCGDVEITPDAGAVAVACSECQHAKLVKARKVVEKALLPWVLSE